MSLPPKNLKVTNTKRSGTTGSPTLSPSTLLFVYDLCSVLPFQNTFAPMPPLAVLTFFNHPPPPLRLEDTKKRTKTKREREGKDEENPHRELKRGRYPKKEKGIEEMVLREGSIHPTHKHEALVDLKWTKAINEELEALQKNST